MSGRQTDDGVRPRLPGARLGYAGLAIVVLASRLPLLPGAGLGRDPDAWRLYLAGRIAAQTGSYAPSRPPGYPALEYLARLLQGAPDWIFGALTTGATAVAVVVLAALARDLGVRAWPLVGLGVAFTSVVYTNSTAFMDYDWALAALSGALLAARRQRPLLTGVLVGLALACRPSSVFAATALPVLFLLLPWWTLRRVLTAGLAALAVAAAFFAVPLATYGRALVSAAPEPFDLGRTLRLMLIGGLGIYGAAGAAAVVAIAVGRRFAGSGRGSLGATERAWAIALGSSIAVQIGGFLLLPIDAAYLIPALAMGWLEAGLLLRRAEVGWLTAAAVAGCLLPGAGVPSVLQATADRRATMVATAATVRSIQALPAGSVVVARGRLPQLLGMAGARLRPSLDPVSPRARVTLAGGQIVSYAYRPSDRSAPRVYRLPGVGGAPAFLPVLPPRP